MLLQEFTPTLIRLHTTYGFRAVKSVVMIRVTINDHNIAMVHEELGTQHEVIK